MRFPPKFLFHLSAVLRELTIKILKYRAISEKLNIFNIKNDL